MHATHREQEKGYFFDSLSYVLCTIKGWNLYCLRLHDDSTITGMGLVPHFVVLMFLLLDSPPCVFMSTAVPGLVPLSLVRDLTIYFFIEL